ncbi:hypothetical protein [Mucilaginibacter sp.]
MVVIGIWQKKSPTKSNIANPYIGMRNQFFALTPTDLQLQIPGDKELALGVIMELGTDDGVATIVSLSTGDASLYTSKGGGIIGGITHYNIKNAAIELVAESQHYFSKMNPSKNINPPKSGNVKIFILTNKNKYDFETTEEEITSPQSTWAALFNKGNEVITQLRLTI